MKEVYKGMLMSVPEMQRKCVAGVRTTAHGPDQNNAEPVEHVGSREQIGPGLSQPGTAARRPKSDMIHLVMAIDNNLHQDHFILQGRYDLLLAPQWGW
jgi:hypothetical protein